MKIDGEKSHNLEYRELKELEPDQVEAQFVSIIDDNYSLSWEVRNQEYQVGITSDQEISEKITGMYENTTNSEIPPEKQDTLSSFTEKNSN